MAPEFPSGSASPVLPHKLDRNPRLAISVIETEAFDADTGDNLKAQRVRSDSGLWQFKLKRFAVAIVWRKRHRAHFMSVEEHTQLCGLMLEPAIPGTSALATNRSVARWKLSVRS